MKLESKDGLPYDDPANLRRKPLTESDEGAVNHPVLFIPGLNRNIALGELTDKQLHEMGPFGRIRYMDKSAAGESVSTLLEHFS